MLFILLYFKKTFGYSNKEPFKYNILNSNDFDDKILKNFKTNFFELDNDFVQLNLPDDNAQNLNNIVDNESCYKSIHGKWIVVNGNNVKYESKSALDNGN